MTRGNSSQPEDLVGERVAGAASTDLLPVLNSAARRLIARWNGGAGAEVDGAEVGEIVLSLAAALTTQGENSDSPAVPGFGLLLQRRVLELLQAEVIREWCSAAPPPEADEMLALLRTFERAREAINPQGHESLLLEPEGAEFVAEVAHDLRSPLTSILFLAEALRSGHMGEVSAVQRRQLGIMYSAALGLINLASDMVELVQGGNRLLEEYPHPFSVSAVLDSVRDMVQPMVEERGLQMQLLPLSPDQRLGHSVALGRVLLNLTVNGVTNTEAGLVEVVTREVRPGRVEFSVRDTGRGFDMANLYQPFRRSRSGSGYGLSGSGLGLAISRRLVTAMGGALQVHSEPSWGTRFYFEIDLPPVPPVSPYPTRDVGNGHHPGVRAPDAGPEDR